MTRSGSKIFRRLCPRHSTIQLFRNISIHVSRSNLSFCIVMLPSGHPPGPWCYLVCAMFSERYLRDYELAIGDREIVVFRGFRV